jgi:hypothetical protein
MSAIGPSQQWIQAVCACLRSENKRYIIVRERARKDWESLFLDGFLNDLYPAIARALNSPGLEAKCIEGMEEPGETYAFFFFHRNQKLYGKLCLQPDGRVIIIYSAHRPDQLEL